MDNKKNILPEYLLEMLENQYSQEDVEKILNGYMQKRNVTLRVNTLKTNSNNICTKLEENGIKYQKALWDENAIILENSKESQIQKLEIYENGKIYLQSLSSMLPPIILNPNKNEDILDMAAAPGGKTTQIAAITSNGSNITACEINNLRAEKLKYNIQKQGATSVNIMITDARKLNDFFAFDKILLDAPCSGSGTIAIEENNKKIVFTKEFADKLEKTQTLLLKKAIKLLKPGKEMIYSTCSILSRENENIVQKILKESNIEVVPINFNGIESIPQLPCKIKGALCVCPNELYEGFFVVKLRKNH